MQKYRESISKFLPMLPFGCLGMFLKGQAYKECEFLCGDMPTWGLTPE
jgi:hypothetical protein